MNEGWTVKEGKQQCEDKEKKEIKEYERTVGWW